MFRKIRDLCAVVAAVVLAIAPGAYGDIGAYNEAVKKGDYAAAAVAAKSAWATLDKTAPEIALIAGEFGFASLVSGDNESALEYARFLVEQGPALPAPDKTPVISRVLFAAADYQVSDGDGKLEALRSALSARQEMGGFDMISVLGWELLYNSSMSAGDFTNAETDARRAMEYFKRMPAMTVARAHSASITATSAEFLKQRGRITQGRNDIYSAMATTHDAVVADINAAQSESLRAQLWPSKWRAEAWSYAIASYLQSTYDQIGSNINSGVKERALARPRFAPVAEDEATSSLPVCAGEFSGRSMKYPSVKAFTGLVGSVIARVETAADGRVTKVEILASVPSKGFEDSVRETLETWTYKPARGVERNACRLNSRNHLYKVMFTVG